HLEALKAGMQPLPKPVKRTSWQSLLVYGLTTSSLLIVSGIIYYGILFLNTLLGENALMGILGTILFLYLVIMWFVSRQPDLEQDDPDAETIELPMAAEVFKTGVHFLIPLVVLIWCLMVELLSPGLSAF